MGRWVYFRCVFLVKSGAFASVLDCRRCIWNAHGNTGISSKSLGLNQSSLLMLVNGTMSVFEGLFVVEIRWFVGVLVRWKCAQNAHGNTSFSSKSLGLKASCWLRHECPLVNDLWVSLGQKDRCFLRVLMRWKCAQDATKPPIFPQI